MSPKISYDQVLADLKKRLTQNRAPKVAIYTLTRDRLSYTRRTFTDLAKLGYPFDHYIWDNGSQDGSVAWLQSYQKKTPRTFVFFHPRNLGIGEAKNRVLAKIGTDYDYILKLDNDCAFVSPNILRELVIVSRLLGDNAVLSPKVLGLDREIPRFISFRLGPHLLSPVPIVGGIFSFSPIKFYLGFKSNPVFKTRKGDPEFADHVWKSGGKIYYVDSLEVEHMDSDFRQPLIYPEFDRRKERELERQYHEMKRRGIGGNFELRRWPYWREVLSAGQIHPEAFIWAFLYMTRLNTVTPFLLSWKRRLTKK